MLWVLLGVVCPLIVAFFLCCLRWAKKYTYWEERQVPCVPAMFPFGSFRSAFTMKEQLFGVIGKAYDEFENEPVVGMYGPTSPCLLVRDATLAKEVIIDRFNYFMDNGLEASKSVDPIFGYNLICLKGQEWKDFRAIHTPVMASSKINGMIGDIINSAKGMMNFIIKEQKETSDVIPYLKMYFIDAVFKCAFGLESQVWSKPGPIVQTLISDGISTSQLEGNISMLSAILIPWANEITRCKVIKHEAMKFAKKVCDIVVPHRRETNTVRNDLVQRLMEVDQKLRDSGKEGLNETTWATNLMLFYTDGTETSTITMSFVIYLLAKHPEVQKKTRDEFRGKGITLNSLDHQKLNTLEYMDMVIKESLRLFPPIPVIYRKATKDTTLGEIRIPKGMKIIIPSVKLQNDSKYFQNPDLFDPSRFDADRKRSVPKGAYLPFGEGPRTCIGMKFAQAAIKVGLIALLSDFELSLGPHHKEEMKLDINSTYFAMPDKGLVEVKFAPAPAFEAE